MAIRENLRLAWPPALVAAGLWVICAAAYGFLTWFDLAPRQFVAYFVPETIPSGVWHWTWPWIVLGPLASTLIVFFVYLLLARVLGSGRESKRSQFLVSWFVAVAAGFVASAAWAAGAIVAAFPPSRAAFVLDPAGDLLLLSAYWGLVWGWLPALIALRGTRSVTRTDPTAPAARRTWSLRAQRTTVILAAIVVVAMTATAAGVGLGSHAARVQSAEETAFADGHTLGAVPDPDAEVTPPVDIIAGKIDSSWCTPEQAVLLLGEKDAATGHRALTIRVSNFSDAPCMLDGYPDLAFADADGSQIDAVVVQGGSFMTQDPGAQPVTVPPGGYAATTLGWNAMPTNGELATYTLYAAMYPGLKRGSWPITLDIIAGGEVAVTAWKLSEAEPSTY